MAPVIHVIQSVTATMISVGGLFASHSRRIGLCLG